MPTLVRAGLFLLCTVICLWTDPIPVHCEEKEGIASSQETALVPDRDIAYASEEIPKWKAFWDGAREFSRQGRYEEALKGYRCLLQNKPNLDEARWEYTSILLHLKKWRSAEEQLGILKSGGKETADYLFAGAEIALHTGKAAQAGKLYSRLYTRFTTGERGTAALDGLTQALIAQGKGRLALPLVEQLLLRQPDELSYQRRAALMMAEIGKPEKAVHLFRRILPKLQGDRRVLKAYAGALDSLGDTDAASVLRQGYFGFDQSDKDVNQALASYYRKKGNRGMELKHLEQLADITAMDNEVFQRVAELNLSLGRIDRALEVSNSILAVQPENQDFSALRERALKALAEEMLTLAENSDVQLLWDDLQNITADRIEVFRSMAAMLREKQKFEELTVVLSVMSGELPTTDPLLKELEILLEHKAAEKKSAAEQ